MRAPLIYLTLAIVLHGCSDSYDGELVLIHPEAGDCFAYPYFLFIPDQVVPDQKTFVVVEPNNSGFVDDDLKKHMAKAENTASNDYYLGNFVSQSLGYPLVVPVFPREESQWRIYTHALDRDVMLQQGTPLERVDNQLIAMFEDAREELAKKHIPTEEKFLLTGFSASGTFANRFTALHPDQVHAVAAGGLNGLLLIPSDSLQNEWLKYPVGTGDFTEITGRGFQQHLFKNTPQFYFMGALDDNDAVPYDDAFDPDEREQIYRLLGEQMMPNRWNYCKSMYDTLNVKASITTYQEVGHKHPDEIKQEVVEFFRASVEAN